MVNATARLQQTTRTVKAVTADVSLRLIAAANTLLADRGLRLIHP